MFTNTPAFLLRKAGWDIQGVRFFGVHGLLTRAWSRVDPHNRHVAGERFLHRMFGRWMSRGLSSGQWDLSYTWSGVSEEYLRAPRGAGVRLLVRGSAHIRTQLRLLEEEQARTHAPQQRPSAWMVAREEREYGLADAIVTLSSFSRASFLDEGLASQRVKLMVAGAPVAAFRASAETVSARCRRISRGEPLRLLCVGSFSYQKGAEDLARICEVLPADRFQVRFVGTVHPEAGALRDKLAARIEFIARVPQRDLVSHYAWGDVFVYPTIQDGFPQVMAQSCAAGLPQLTTPNGAGMDLVRDGINGWVLPIRSPETFIARLRWCDAQRDELAAMTSQCATSPVRSWRDAADDLVAIAKEMADFQP